MGAELFSGTPVVDLRSGVADQAVRSGSVLDLPAVDAALDGVYGAFINTDGFEIGDKEELYAGRTCLAGIVTAVELTSKLCRNPHLRVGQA